MVQWLKFDSHHAGGLSSILDHGTRSHRPKLKILCAATKTQCSKKEKEKPTPPFLYPNDFPDITGKNITVGAECSLLL